MTCRKLRLSCLLSVALSCLLSAPLSAEYCFEDEDYEEFLTVWDGLKQENRELQTQATTLRQQAMILVEQQERLEESLNEVRASSSEVTSYLEEQRKENLEDLITAIVLSLLAGVAGGLLLGR